MYACTHLSTAYLVADHLTCVLVVVLIWMTLCVQRLRFADARELCCTVKHVHDKQRDGGTRHEVEGTDLRICHINSHTPTIFIHTSATTNATHATMSMHISMTVINKDAQFHNHLASLHFFVSFRTNSVFHKLSIASQSFIFAVPLRRF